MAMFDQQMGNVMYWSVTKLAAEHQATATAATAVADIN